MRRLLLFLLLGLAIALSLNALFKLESGYVYIGVKEWRIEMSLIMLCIITFGSALLLFVALITSGKLLNMGFSAGNWLRHSKERKASKNTQAGLVAYLEGDWSRASKLLKSSAGHAENPVISYLAAAHCANELGQTKDAEQFLLNAYSHTDESDFAVGLAKARLTLEQGELETSLATLIRLKSMKPSHPSVLKLLRSVYLKLEDWEQLIQLLPELKKVKGENASRINKMEEDVWRKLFTSKSEALRKNDIQQGGAGELADIWKRMPNSIRFDTSVLSSYAEQLIEMNEFTEAEALLRKMLSKHWDDQLVTLYGKVRSHEPDEQLIVAEKWLKERPNNAALLLTLGRIALQSELWGKAQEYLLASQQLNSNVEVCAELCRLDLHLKARGIADKSGEQTQSEHVKELVESLKLPPITGSRS